MIKRNSSKITDSLVNSSHEEHFNVSKAIRDDAAITSTTSVVSSINFESDRDGAYILRKPLVKKQELDKSTQFLLANKSDILSLVTEEDSETHEVISKSILITNNPNIILKFYDNTLKLHEYTYTDGLEADWLEEIVGSYIAPDHLILNVRINHDVFLHTVDFAKNIRRSMTLTWMLVYDHYTNSHIDADTPTGNILKRYVKVYTHESLDNTYVFEIVHPEFNSITSGLDVGNANTLDINLLLDNPYAIRDLYGYGYVSTTKILPYVYKLEDTDEESSISDIGTYKLWELTEEFGDFSILESANPTFNRKFLILKAFLTTAVTGETNYYCCWEESTNGGIDWQPCQPFLDKAENAGLTIVEKTVSDLTYSDFNEKLNNESLESAETYLVDKKVVLLDLNAKDFSEKDFISNRPDVLILETPDLSKLYRFQVYVDSNRTTPTPTNATKTDIISDFASTFGNIDEDGKIKYTIAQNAASESPSVDDNLCLTLDEGTTTITSPNKHPTVLIGSSLKIYTEDDDYVITSVVITLDRARLSNDINYGIGAFIGFSSTLTTDISLPVSRDTDDARISGSTPVTQLTPYNTKLNITYDYPNSTVFPPPEAWWAGTINTVETDYVYLNSNHWVLADCSKAITLSNLTNNTGKQVYIVNLSNAAYRYSYNENASGYSRLSDTPVGTKYVFFYNEYDWEDNYTLQFKNQNDLDITLSTEVYLSNPSYPNTTYYKVLVVEKQAPSSGYPNGYFNISVYTSREERPNGSVSSWVKYNYYRSNFYYNITQDIKVTHSSKNYKNFRVLKTTNDLTQYNYTQLQEDSNFPHHTITLDNPTKIIDYTDFKEFLKEKNLGINGIDQIKLKIKSITVNYVVSSTVKIASIYLASTTGNYQIPYNANSLKLVEDLTLERDRLFSGQMFYNDNQKQFLVYKDEYVYVSGTNSAIMRLLNSLSLPDEITNIIPWRGYLLLFSPRSIYLSKYDTSSDSYTIKTLSNTVGVSKVDAKTIVPILNSIYFKSGAKIYRLVPNLYASTDDILNIHQISTGVNTILETIYNTYDESNNFGYADADSYNIFIPVSTSSTYRITYDFVKQVWNVFQYYLELTDIVKISHDKIYLYDDSYLYYFRESLDNILRIGIALHADETFEFDLVKNAVKYADYPGITPGDIISNIASETYSPVPINFKIDFGQKSTNYTLDKQFLESKLIFATLAAKDTIPVSIDIYTDGISRELHWDANTDGAIWKTSLNDVGILNTDFGIDGQDYNGIFRQLIVKYSGKGKSVRHVISGESQTLFKFYSLDVRARILPKKH